MRRDLCTAPAAAESMKEVFRLDYAPPSFKIHHVNLDFNIRDGETIVKSNMRMERMEGVNGDLDLELHGEAMPS